MHARYTWSVMLLSTVMETWVLLWKNSCTDTGNALFFWQKALISIGTEPYTCLIDIYLALVVLLRDSQIFNFCHCKLTDVFPPYQLDQLDQLLCAGVVF